MVKTTKFSLVLIKEADSFYLQQTKWDTNVFPYSIFSAWRLENEYTFSLVMFLDKKASGVK